MPATIAQAETALKFAARNFWDLQQTNAPAINTTGAAVLTNYNGDEAIEITAAIQAQRSALAGIVYGGCKSLLTRCLLDLSHAAGIAYEGNTISNEMFVRLRQYYDDVGPFAGGSKDSKFTARGWTRGSVSYNGTPDMNIYRLTEDEYGQAIETGWPQVVRFECLSPAGSRQKTIGVYPGDAGRDVFDVQGRGGSAGSFQLFDHNNAGSMLPKTNFSGLSAADGVAVASADITPFTLSGTWAVNKTQFYRSGSSATAVFSSSIKCTSVNGYIQCTMSGTPTKRQPYAVFAWVYPAAGFNAASGTVVLTWGSKSQTFSSLTDSQWNLLVITRDKNMYPEQWDTSAADSNIVKVLVGVSTAGLTVGMVGMVPLTRMAADNMWWAGSNGITKAVPLDAALQATGTFTDTLSAAGKHQHALALTFPDLVEAYLPVTVGSSAMSD